MKRLAPNRCYPFGVTYRRKFSEKLQVCVKLWLSCHSTLYSNLMNFYTVGK
ncbi:Uncharacterised protein [Vibrio cholerae]|nr:Uncharacterised protein [Vibrio cholerae]